MNLQTQQKEEKVDLVILENNIAMEVRKSDNTVEDYSEEKIRNGIKKAFFNSGNFDKYNEQLSNSIIQSINVYDNISTSEIRRQVEEELMSVNKQAAREYIKTYDAIAAENVNLLKKFDFIHNYIAASNAATGSVYDPNANVSQKNVVTMGNELYKYDNIKQNRRMMYDRIMHLFGKHLAKQYIIDLENHVLYKHDETSIPGVPYCVSIAMYSFLIDGITKIGGISTKPTDLKSYCGEFVNLVFSVASQFAGAVATPEFLLFMDYFIRKDYGDNYLERLDEVVEKTTKQRTLEKVIENSFQQVVHSINMPSGNRGYQPVFWNIGYFDHNYYNGVFGDFTFPDGSRPQWETLNWLQKKFMRWFNEERTKYIITFPVETMALLTDSENVIDEEYRDFTAQMWAEGHSFFCYLSDSPDSLSSCCRLRNSLKDLQDTEHNYTTHQFSMGTASVATGSKSVMTINLNRVIQQAVREYIVENSNSGLSINEEDKSLCWGDVKKDLMFGDLMKYVAESISTLVQRVHKYQKAFNSIIEDFIKYNMLPVYNAGFISSNKQYLTIGVNGLTDAAEFMGLKINFDEPDYATFVNTILETINVVNRTDKTKNVMFNTEFVPGENLSVKNYRWDKNDGYFVSSKHEMYSSYFFNPEDSSLNILDKMKLHGRDFVKYLDGGSACHININEHLSKAQYLQLLKVAAQNGTNYFTFNCRNTVCNDCGYISKDTLDKCPRCGSENLDYLTRIIGYLKRVSCFSEPRQREEAMRSYTKE